MNQGKDLHTFVLHKLKMLDIQNLLHILVCKMGEILYNQVNRNRLAH